MNDQPIEQALDDDLRQSKAAMKRAAERAREVAVRTGTELVVTRGGAIEHVKPEAAEARSWNQAAAGDAPAPTRRDMGVAGEGETVRAPLAGEDGREPLARKETSDSVVTRKPAT